MAEKSNESDDFSFLTTENDEKNSKLKQCELKKDSEDFSSNNDSSEEMISCDETEQTSIKKFPNEGVQTENLSLSSNLKSTLSAQNTIQNSSNETENEKKINNYTLEIIKDSHFNENSVVRHSKNIPFSDIPSTSNSDNFSKEKNNILIEQIQTDLETATAILEADQAKQNRQNRTVQDHMVEECKELLQLFGIPFVVSPTEAEAQCAFYDFVDLSHGTITDDSDVFLFGGRRVYKNFFTQQKYVECFKSNEIFNHFSLNRKKLINFAMLTGSDYTVGIEGVGPVAAMEILSEFPGEDIEALQKFKNWWINKNVQSPENKIRAKLQKLILPDSFPNEMVCDAYLNPVIDNSKEKFSWGRPDLDALRDYARERFGWNKSKVDDVLLPVIKKLNERESQTHLDSFFSMNLKKQTDLFPSKRIMSALKKMTSPQKDSSTNKPQIKKTKKKNLKKKSLVNKNKCRAKVQKCELILSEESSDDC